jgi:hypothetical protein
MRFSLSLAFAGLLLAIPAHAMPQGQSAPLSASGQADADYSYQENPVKEQNGIRYASGGVGEEELAQLKAHEAEFNLKLLNTGKRGEFVGTYALRIANARGEEVFTGTGEGPLFYLNLPAGRYTVSESMEGNTDQTQTVTVGKGLKQFRFYWNARD